MGFLSSEYAIKSSEITSQPVYYNEWTNELTVRYEAKTLQNISTKINIDSESQEKEI